jgi:hypothetical protein
MLTTDRIDKNAKYDLNSLSELRGGTYGQTEWEDSRPCFHYGLSLYI